MKARRMRSWSPKPVSRATLASACSLPSIIARAADCPVSALKAQLNWRGERCATSTSSSTNSGWRRWARAVGELVTIPALPAIEDWNRFNAARLALGPGLSRSQPAARYNVK
jgi:hypothetical protein